MKRKVIYWDSNKPPTLERRLLEDVYAHPADPVRKQVLSDWYEDQGDVLRAEFWRWVSEKGLYPDRDIGGKEDCPWWNDPWYHAEGDRIPRHTLLPQGLHDKLSPYREGAGLPRGPKAYLDDGSQDFHTVEDGFVALSGLWCTLSLQERREYWDWQSYR